MGSWNSADPFGNDEALDWADALAELPTRQRPPFIRQTFDAFAAFEDRRARGLNKAVRTPEVAAQLLAMFQQPVAEIIERTVRDGIGQEFEDPGGDETFRLVAAAHVILAAVSGDRTHLPLSLREIDLSEVASDTSLAAEAHRLLALTRNNKLLGRDAGTAWVRANSKLRERLAPYAGAVPGGSR